MSRLLFAALAVVCFLVPAYGQTTTIADHLQLAASAPNQAPTPVIGKIKINYPAFTDVNGQFYAAASQVVTIAPDGSFSAALPASDTSTKQGDDAAGGLYYSVTYYAASSGVVVSTDQWFVHASATPLTIADVTMHSSDPVLSFDPKGSAAAVLASSLQKSANLSDVANVATAKQNLGLVTVATTGRFEDLVDAPILAPVASSGLYSDLTGKPTIPTKVSDLTNDSNFLTSLTVAPVAISGAYADLTGKPSLSTVASTGSYNDLTDKPVLSFDASGAAAQVLASSLQKSANLSDLTDVNAAKAALNLAPVASSGVYGDLSGKPTLATVASSGSYLDLTHLPTIPTKTSQLTNDSSFVATTDLSTVATTGAYADLSGKPALAAVATSGLYTDLSGRPTISTVGSTGNYSDLLGKPVLSTVATSGKYVDLIGAPDLATVATSGLYTDLLNAPAVPTKVSDLPNDAGYVAASSLATVATTGAYADLSGKPALNFDPTGSATAAQAASLQKSANLSDVPDKAAARSALQLAAVANTGAYSDLSGKPTLATVATSGSYLDLTHQPSIPTKTSQLTNDSSFVATTDLATVATTGAYADITGKPVLAPVATSGLYTDLSGKPTISTVGSTGNYSDLLGKPVLATVATSGAYGDLSELPSLSLVATTGKYTDLIGAPTVPTKTSQLTNDAGFAVAADLATVASTGSYADLSNKPALNFDPTGTAAAVQAASLQKSANLSDVADAATARANLQLAPVANTGSYTDLTNKPAFSVVALSGSYLDLTHLPTIPTKTSQLTNDAGFAVASTLASVATTGSYVDLTNKPTIPTKVSDLTNDAGYVNATTAPVVSINGLTGAVALSFLTPGNNLSDLTNVTTAKTNLHLATVATSGSYADLVNAPTLGTASSHPLSDFVLTSQVNAANGVPGLDASSQIALAQIPSLTLAKISDAGTAASHAFADFLASSALGVTVAPLDANKKLPSANLPAISYNSLTDAPALAPVATSGSYADLTNKPAGLPPIGACGGDLGGTYPNCTVVGLNSTNLASLGVGLLKVNNGVPALASNSDITTALTFVPMNPANNLSELTDQALARTHLGLGSIASMNALSFLADNGTNGIPFRISPGTTRVATGPDLVNLFGYQPVNPDQLGVTIATLDGTTHKLTGSQLPPVDWSDVTNAPTFVKTSDIGTTVAPLVNGKVPTDNLPSYPDATATSQGIASFPSSGALLVSAGAVSVDRSQFDAAGVAAAAQSASLQKSANLSDLPDKAAARSALQLAAVAASGSYSDLTNKPSLSAVALSGAYADLTGKPSIPSKVSDLTNDLNFVQSSALAAIATTGNYSDLHNAPFIPTKISDLPNDAKYATESEISKVGFTGQYADLFGAPALATVATTGSYTDLVNIPAAPVISTVGHTGQYTDILNLPTLGTISSHNIGDFVSSSLVGAANGVAALDQNSHIPAVNMPVGISAANIDQGEVSNTEYSYLDGVTSPIQTQLNGVLKMTSGSAAGIVYYDGSTQSLTSKGFGTANGVADLDSGGLLKQSEMPTTINATQLQGNPLKAGTPTQDGEAYVWNAANNDFEIGPAAATLLAGPGIITANGAGSSTVSVDPTYVETVANAQQAAQIYCASSGGSSSNYSCSTSPAVTSLTVPMFILWKPDVNGSGGSMTLNVSGLGAKTLIEANGNAPTTSDIQAGGIYPVSFDGTSFRIIGGSSFSMPAGSPGAAVVLGSSGALSTAGGAVFNPTSSDLSIISTDGDALKLGATGSAFSYLFYTDPTATSATATNGDLSFYAVAGANTTAPFSINPVASEAGLLANGRLCWGIDAQYTGRKKSACIEQVADGSAGNYGAGQLNFTAGYVVGQADTSAQSFGFTVDFSDYSADLPRNGTLCWTNQEYNSAQANKDVCMADLSTSTKSTLSVQSAATDSTNLEIINGSTGGHAWKLSSGGTNNGAGTFSIGDVTTDILPLSFDDHGMYGYALEKIGWTSDSQYANPSNLDTWFTREDVGKVTVHGPSGLGGMYAGYVQFATPSAPTCGGGSGAGTISNAGGTLQYCDGTSEHTFQFTN